MNSKLKALAAVAVLALSSTAAEAQTYTPVGVQNDVSYSDVINGGWSEVYRGDYGSNVSVASIFDQIAAGSQIMLAAIKDGSTTFDVLAAARVEDVLQVTALNQTHAANGANWYFNGSSMGFAGLNDTIKQVSADVAGSGEFGFPVVERDRLSWHTSGSNASDMTINGGWRSGSNIWLNSSTDWNRVVLVAAPVPEPETYALLLAGLGMVGSMARRRKQAKA